MSRSGFWVRIGGAVALAGVSIGIALHLGFWANFNGSSVDYGVQSALALVSNRPDDAAAGTLEFLNVSPESGAKGRLTFYIDGGNFTSSGAREPRDSINPDVSGSTSAGAGSNQGFAVVLGGALGKSLTSCDKSDDVVVAKNQPYSKLSEIERDTIVSNIAAQGENRVIAFGNPSAPQSSKTAVHLAAQMKYTVLQFSTLYPDKWSMTVTHSKALGGESSSTSVDAVGYYGLARCAYDESKLMTKQVWGLRFEMPPTTVSTAPVGPADVTQAEAIRDVYRLRDTPDFTYYTQYSFDKSSTSENGGGVVASEDKADAARGTDKPRATASVSQGAMGFENTSYPQLRDLGIFVAGAAASFAASLLIAILKTIARTMRPFRHRPPEETSEP